MANIAIVGAGVVGLSTAYHLRKLLPTSKLTIIADKFYKDTTSYGAGGLFRPNAEHILGMDAETIRRWSLAAFNHYSSLALSSEAQESGHMVLPGYVFSQTPVINPLYKDLVFSFRELTPQELQKLGVKYKYGYQVTTVITDLVYYLPWLMRRHIEVAGAPNNGFIVFLTPFKEAGGIVQFKTVESLEEFIGQYDVVVNCTGFRSRDLVNDKAVYPVRGHLVQVKAPWIKHWVYTEDLAYFVPRVGDIVSLGGIRQKNNFSKEIDPKDTEGILQRCHEVWPSLKSAPIVSEWVDLRPHRDPVRVERETVSNSKGTLQVVHNYGHGANGITLSWGSAIDASNLVIKGLQQKGSKL